MVRPCVLRHRVTVPTLCPLGEPEIAIGPEPRIEPWLPRNRIACQVSRAGGRCHYSKMNRGNGRAIQRRTSRAIESHQQIVGWISRQKISRLPAEGEPFLLTRTLSLLENEPRERKSHPEKNLSSDREPSANSGLDIETKNLSATGRGRTFFVDIPFYRTIYLRLR